MVRQQYSKAPITEAIIDVRVKLPKSATLALVDQCGTLERDRYPAKAKLRIAMGKMEWSEEASTTSATSKQIGYIFKSPDQKRVFQAHLQGFTVNKLAPYDCWESFRDEAKRLWGVYREICQPVAIQRIAVRYINRLDLPLPLDRLSDYLHTAPPISPGLPQAVVGFLLQLRIQHDDIRSTALLNQAPIEPIGPESVSVVLDIDLFREVDIPLDDSGLWTAFEELHARENQIFEACITPKTRELIR